MPWPRRGIANLAGAPVDSVAYLTRRAGVPVTQPAFGSDQYANWLTGPIRSTDIVYQLYRQAFDTPPPQEALCYPPIGKAARWKWAADAAVNGTAT